MTGSLQLPLPHGHLKLQFFSLPLLYHPCLVLKAHSNAECVLMEQGCVFKCHQIPGKVFPLQSPELLHFVVPVTHEKGGTCRLRFHQVSFLERQCMFRNEFLIRSFSFQNNLKVLQRIFTNVSNFRRSIWNLMTGSLLRRILTLFN